MPVSKHSGYYTALPCYYIVPGKCKYVSQVVCSKGSERAEFLMLVALAFPLQTSLLGYRQFKVHRRYKNITDSTRRGWSSDSGWSCTEIISFVQAPDGNLHHWHVPPSAVPILALQPWGVDRCTSAQSTCNKQSLAIRVLHCCIPRRWVTLDRQHCKGNIIPRTIK
jgi:hypothetical protein